MFINLIEFNARPRESTIKWRLEEWKQFTRVVTNAASGMAETRDGSNSEVSILYNLRLKLSLQCYAIYII